MDVRNILFFLGVVLSTNERVCEEKRYCWSIDTFSEITSIFKYAMVSLVYHSLRGVAKVQVFVVMDFWKGCNSIGTVNLKVSLLILKPCPSLDIQLWGGVVEEPLKGCTQKDS